MLVSLVSNVKNTPVDFSVSYLLSIVFFETRILSNFGEESFFFTGGFAELYIGKGLVGVKSFEGFKLFSAFLVFIFMANLSNLLNSTDFFSGVFSIFNELKILF